MNTFLLKSFVGLSDFENKGIKGSFKFGSGLDVRREMDSLYSGYDLVEDLGAGTMTDTALFIVNSSDGNSYHFCRDGKIFKRTSAGVYTLVYTDSDGVITGAVEWENDVGDKFLYWATSTKLHRKTIPGVSDWSDVDATVNGQTYPKTNLTSSTWHTMKEIGGNMFISNSNTIAMVGYDDSYTTNALQLTPGNIAKCLVERNDGFFGCSRSDNSKEAQYFIWDTISTNYNAKRFVPSEPINAIVNAEQLLFQAGTKGNIFTVDGSFYTVPLVTLPDRLGSVNPDGTDVIDGIALFGFFGNGYGKTGVYSYGRLKKNAPSVLNLDYPLTCDEIGSIKVVGSDILVSYKNGTNYGVKKVGTSRGTGTYQSLDLVAPINIREPLWTTIRITTAPLPESCSVQVYRRTDKNGSFVQANLEGGGTSFNTTGGQEAVFLVGDKGKVCEVQIVLNPSGANSPEVYTCEVSFE